MAQSTETPTGSPVSRTRSSPSRSVVPRANPIVVRVRALPVRPDPPGQPARGHDPAPGRRRDPAARTPGAAPDLLGRLRPLPQGAGRLGRRRVLGRAHRQAADLRARAAGLPRTRTGPSTSRPPMVESLAELGVEYRRDQPDRAVHLRRLPRADPARDARPRATSTRSSTGTAPRRPAREDAAAEAAATRPSWRPSRGLRRGRRGRRQRRRRRLLPVQALLRRLREGPDHGHRVRRRHHRADLHLRVRALRDRPADRVQPRQAGLEGRLADALGLRGRGLRAVRRRPLLARVVVRRRRADRRRDLRRRAADRPDVRLRRHQRHGEDVLLARAACRPRPTR